MTVAAISRETAANLDTVAKFFGIDMEWNRHIFRRAANADAAGFERVVAALAEAVRQDVRFGVMDRMRTRVAADRAERSRRTGR